MLIALPVSAEDAQQQLIDQYDVEELYDAIPDQVEPLLHLDGNHSSEGFLDGIFDALWEGLRNGHGAVREAMRLMARILLLLLLCQIVEASCGERMKTVTAMACVLAISACSTEDIHVLIGLGKDTMKELSVFSSMLLPVMSGISAAAGSAGRAAVTYTLTVFFSNLLLQLGNTILIPMIYAYIGLAASESVLRQGSLKPVREKLGWILEWGLKGIVYGFIGLLSLTGAVAGSADAAAVKATKTILSSFVPVVGGIISGAADTILNSAVLIRQSIGAAGMLSVLVIFLTPFLQMGASWLMLKVLSVLSGILGSKLTGLMEGIAGAMGYMMALVGSSVLIVLISCCSMLKAVH